MPPRPSEVVLVPRNPPKVSPVLPKRLWLRTGIKEHRNNIIIVHDSPNRTAVYGSCIPTVPLPLRPALLDPPLVGLLIGGRTEHNDGLQDWVRWVPCMRKADLLINRQMKIDQIDQRQLTSVSPGDSPSCTRHHRGRHSHRGPSRQCPSRTRT